MPTSGCGTPTRSRSASSSSSSGRGSPQSSVMLRRPVRTGSARRLLLRSSPTTTRSRSSSGAGAGVRLLDEGTLARLSSEDLDRTFNAICAIRRKPTLALARFKALLAPIIAVALLRCLERGSCARQALCADSLRRFIAGGLLPSSMLADPEGPKELLIMFMERENIALCQSDAEQKLVLARARAALDALFCAGTSLASLSQRVEIETVVQLCASRALMVIGGRATRRPWSLLAVLLLRRTAAASAADSDQPAESLPVPEAVFANLFVDEPRYMWLIMEKLIRVRAGASCELIDRLLAQQLRTPAERRPALRLLVNLLVPWKSTLLPLDGAKRVKKVLRDLLRDDRLGRLELARAVTLIHAGLRGRRRRGSTNAVVQALDELYTAHGDRLVETIVQTFAWVATGNGPVRVATDLATRLVNALEAGKRADQTPRALHGALGACVLSMPIVEYLSRISIVHGWGGRLLMLMGELCRCFGDRLARRARDSCFDAGVAGSTLAQLLDRAYKLDHTCLVRDEIYRDRYSPKVYLDVLGKLFRITVRADETTARRNGRGGVTLVSPRSSMASAATTQNMDSSFTSMSGDVEVEIADSKGTALTAVIHVHGRLSAPELRRRAAHRREPVLTTERRQPTR